MLCRGLSIALMMTFSLSFTPLMLALPRRVTRLLYTVRLTLHKDDLFFVSSGFLKTSKNRKNFKQYLGKKKKILSFHVSLLTSFVQYLPKTKSSRFMSILADFKGSFQLQRILVCATPCFQTTVHPDTQTILLNIN